MPRPRLTPEERREKNRQRHKKPEGAPRFQAGSPGPDTDYEYVWQGKYVLHLPAWFMPKFRYPIPKET